MSKKEPGHINVAIHGGFHESSVHLISLVLLVSPYNYECEVVGGERLQE